MLKAHTDAPRPDHRAGHIVSETPSVCTAVCGDGFKRGSEECDDGNDVPGDGTLLRTFH